MQYKDITLQRVRIRLTPLTKINDWRSVIVYKEKNEWKAKLRK